EDHRIAQS
ncbi:hypothetical protein D030_2758, partial [Vibrio parahaemolyticus AQ3810]